MEAWPARALLLPSRHGRIVSASGSSRTRGCPVSDGGKGTAAAASGLRQRQALSSAPAVGGGVSAYVTECVMWSLGWRRGALEEGEASGAQSATGHAANLKEPHASSDCELRALQVCRRTIPPWLKLGSSNARQWKPSFCMC